MIRIQNIYHLFQLVKSGENIFKVLIMTNENYGYLKLKYFQNILNPKNNKTNIDILLIDKNFKRFMNELNIAMIEYDTKDFLMLKILHKNMKFSDEATPDIRLLLPIFEYNKETYCIPNAIIKEEQMHEINNVNDLVTLVIDKSNIFKAIIDTNYNLGALSYPLSVHNLNIPSLNNNEKVKAIIVDRCLENFMIYIGIKMYQEKDTDDFLVLKPLDNENIEMLLPIFNGVSYGESVKYCIPDNITLKKNDIVKSDDYMEDEVLIKMEKENIEDRIIYVVTATLEYQEEKNTTLYVGNDKSIAFAYELSEPYTELNITVWFKGKEFKGYYKWKKKWEELYNNLNSLKTDIEKIENDLNEMKNTYEMLSLAE